MNLSNHNLSALALVAGVLLVAGPVAGQAAAPAPLPPLPSLEQLAWQQGDQALFLRIGLNTFTGEEQASGQEDAGLFNPDKFAPQQWVNVAKECGARRLVLEVKGHGGFCLWPTKSTGYSVQSSSWRDGHGDVVKEFTDACRQAGLESGFYLSCEDRNHTTYGTPAYNAVYLTQLTELLSNYGPWSEVRFDNAGGEGVGGAGTIGRDPKERKQTYDWTNYFSTVARLQPKAIVVSVVGPGARWNGNNGGHSGEPNWATFDPKAVPGPEPTDRKQLNVLNFGDPNGSVWRPAECFVALRPHWFWRAEDENQVMPLDRMFNTWCKSIGRGNVLLWNVALNRDGLIPDADAARLRELRDRLEQVMRTDLAAGKPATASNTRGGEAAFGPAQALDGDRNTYWATDDTVTNECWLEVDLGSPRRFTMSALCEPIGYGQRVGAYRIEFQESGEWKLAVHGTTIGRLKIERFKPVTARRVRVVIEKTRACPLISGFSLYDN